MEQMADFEDPDTWDLASTSQQEPQYDNFTADVVDESVSLISSCQQIMQLGEAPLGQNVPRPQVHQNPNKKPHPTTGKKHPRKQFMLETASRKISEGPNAKKVTTSESAMYTSGYSQVPIACNSNSKLPEVCNNCTVLLKELEDARYQIQTLTQKLEGTVCQMFLRFRVDAGNVHVFQLLVTDFEVFLPFPCTYAVVKMLESHVPNGTVNSNWILLQAGIIILSHSKIPKNQNRLIK